MITLATSADFAMVCADSAIVGNGRGSPFDVGAKRSWVPVLGKIVWEVSDEDETKGYYAYIFENSDGQRIGYVRVPDYSHRVAALEMFEQLIIRFQGDAVALVFDQVNNPGGSMFHMYAMLSRLTDRPLPLPQHQLSLSEEDVATAAKVVAEAGTQSPERVSYSRLLLAEVDAGRGPAGRRKTNPLYLGGVKEIQPARNRYAGKIVVLSNELTFSAGEFLAAILQDSRRATLFGMRTAGAGGCARAVIIPGSQQLGIGQITLTWTLARRTNGEFIESRGVTPDVAYVETAEDFQSDDPFREGGLVSGHVIAGFQGYRRALLQTLATVTSQETAGVDGSMPTEIVNNAGSVGERGPRNWRPTQADLHAILEQHRLWRESKTETGKTADLRGVDLTEAKLNGIDLAFVMLSGANLNGADLSETDLAFANLRGVTLRGANLRKAQLRSAYLSGADLSDANLSGANLSDANLSAADLSDANLRGAALLDAYLPGANLSGADLRETTGLAPDQLRAACAAPERPASLPQEFDQPPPCANRI